MPKKRLEVNGETAREMSVEQRRENFLKMKGSIKDDWRILRSNSVDKYVPFGFLTLDAVLGLKGIYNRGRVVHIHGNEFSGKSSLVYGIMRNYQRQTKEPVALFDFERTVTSEYLRGIGVDEDMALIYMPDCIEQGVELAMNALQSGVRLLSFDSIPRMLPKVSVQDVVTGKYAKEQPGTHARAMKAFYKALLPKAAEYDASFLMVNQMRARIEMTQEAARAAKYPSYTNLPYTLPGGRETRYVPSVMLELTTKRAYSAGGMGEDEAFVIEPGNKKGPIVATEIGARVLKNKTNSSSLRKSTMFHRPMTGFDENLSIRQMARATGLLSAVGRRYVVGENADNAIKVYDNKDDAIKDLVIEQNQDVLLKLRECVINKIQSENGVAASDAGVDDDLSRYISGEDDEFDSLDVDDL